MSQYKIPGPFVAPTLYSYGSNNLDSDEIAQERQSYDILVFPTYAIEDNFDFWHHDTYYGRVSPAGTASIVKESFLKQLNYTDTGPLFAMNFVADAWRDFAEKVRTLVEEGVLYDSGPYADMSAVKAWRSATVEYHEYMLDQVYASLKDQFLSLLLVDKNIKNFDDFLGVFSDFIYEMGIPSGGPLTLTGYMESNYTSPLNTGLVIEISDADHSDDLNKIQTFLNDANFDVVVNLASQYGFLIDKHAPWRFVADITSPVMAEYMFGLPPITGFDRPSTSYLACDDPLLQDQAALSGPVSFSLISGFRDVLRHAPGYPAYKSVTSPLGTVQRIQEIMDVAYYPAYFDDLLLLKVYIKDFYNAHIDSTPYLIEYDEVQRQCDNYRNRAIRRYPIKGELFRPMGRYGFKWDLKSYYLMRIAERKITKSLRERKKDIQNFLNVYYFSEGTMRHKYNFALKFITDEFIGLRNIIPFRSFTRLEDSDPLSSEEVLYEAFPDSGQQKRMRGNLYRG
mgnify:CR=1 FL=1